MTTREVSRLNHTASSQTANETINIGSLQRIADAVEKMAASYDNLRQTKDWAIERGDRYLKELQRARNQIRSLKGVITKLKRAGVR